MARRRVYHSQIVGSSFRDGCAGIARRPSRKSDEGVLRTLRGLRPHTPYAWAAPSAGGGVPRDPTAHAIFKIHRSRALTSRPGRRPAVARPLGERPHSESAISRLIGSPKVPEAERKGKRSEGESRAKGKAKRRRGGVGPGGEGRPHSLGGSKWRSHEAANRELARCDWPRAYATPS